MDAALADLEREDAERHRMAAGIARPVLVQRSSTGSAYCVRVAARSDRDATGGEVVSDWTQLGGPGATAFVYAAPPPTSPGVPFATLGVRLP